MAATFGRFTSDATGDLARTWCWQPADLANALLPAGPLTADEIDAAIDAIADDDAHAARELREQAAELEWTGANWSVRADGIPGLEMDEDESAEDLLGLLGDAGTLSADAPQFVVFEGEYVGEEYEASVTTGRACRFLPTRIVRIIDR